MSVLLGFRNEAIPGTNLMAIRTGKGLQRVLVPVSQPQAAPASDTNNPYTSSGVGSDNSGSTALRGSVASMNDGVNLASIKGKKRESLFGN